MKFKGILFDLDGTLLYTNDLVVETFQYSFKKILNIDLEREEIMQYFGEPLETTFKRYSEEKTALLLKTYRDYNKKKHDSLAKVFPKALETVKYLKEQKLKIAVVTSKKNDIAQHGLEYFGLSPYIDTLVGADDTKKHKPSKEPAVLALKRLDLKAEDALMVGDSPYDILCAKNAQVKTALVEYTEHPIEELLKLEPDYLLKDLGQLKNIIKN